MAQRNNNVSTDNALAYPLIACIYAHIDVNNNRGGSTLYSRINLTALLYQFVNALMPDPDEKTLINMAYVERRLSKLRSSYEPALDLMPYTFERRALFDLYLDDVMTDLMNLINDKQVVKNSMMASFNASFWSGEKTLGKT